MPAETPVIVTTKKCSLVENRGAGGALQDLLPTLKCQQEDTTIRRSERRLGAGLPVDVQDANEGVLLERCVQGLVDVLHNPAEQLGIDVLG